MPLFKYYNELSKTVRILLIIYYCTQVNTSFSPLFLFVATDKTVEHRRGDRASAGISGHQQDLPSETEHVPKPRP